MYVYLLNYMIRRFGLTRRLNATLKQRIMATRGTRATTAAAAGRRGGAVLCRITVSFTRLV